MNGCNSFLLKNYFVPNAVYISFLFQLSLQLCVLLLLCPHFSVYILCPILYY